MSTNPDFQPRVDQHALPTCVRVAFVGAGPGDVGLLTVRAAELLAAADSVVVDSPAAEEIAARYARPGATVIEATHGDRGSALTHASWAKLVSRAASSVGAAAKETGSGGLLVRLFTGDPTSFQGLAAEMSACYKAGHDAEIVPGVSTGVGVAAYAGIPLTSRDSGTVHFVDAAAPDADYVGGAGVCTTVVMQGSAEQLASGLGHLLAAGRDAHTPVALTEKGTTVEQRTTTTTLEQAALGLADGGLGRPDIALVGATVSLRDELSWYETRPLFGWRVLVPRTKDQAGHMMTRLGEYGAKGEVVPTISVEPPRTPQQMRRAINGLVTGRYEWVGFTSVNAVKAVREKLEEIGLDVRAFAGLKLAAVGGATADALREMGLEPDLMPTGEQSARGLLEVWPPYDDVLDPINGVFLPRADIATDTLVAGLQQMGWEVDDVTAYRTVRAAPPAAPIRDAIKQGAYDAVLFTSSSTVRNLVGIAGKPHPSTVIACIGPATAKTAEDHGLVVSVLADHASGDALVDALAGYGHRLRAAALTAGEPVRRPSESRPVSRRKAR